MESIHPNDIITMDLNSISYLTLKNGNMVLIDDSVPEKGNKDNLPKSSIFGKGESKQAPKKIKLEIASPTNLFFKGIKININEESDRIKYDYKKPNQIIKNESFYFKGIKINQNLQNDFNNNNIYEKENIPLNNNNFNIEKTTKVHFNLDNKNNIYNQTQSSKENEIPQIKNIQNNNIINNNYYNNNINSENHIQSENQNNLNSNINTNMSIPISNIYNNNNIDKMNLNSNNSNNNINQTSKRKNKSKIFGFFGKDKKVRISINAVCSLNIKAEDKYKINLINQFNNLVDRLNEEREKGTVTKMLENEKADKYSKFYPLYKNKTHNEMIKKNFELMNQNYNINKDFNIETNSKPIGNKTLNNFYKKDNFGINSFGNSNKNFIFNQSSRRVSGQSTNEIEKLKNRIQRLSTGIVRPSNRMFNI